MTLRQELNESMKTAMKARDDRRLSCLRMVLAAIKDKDIANRTETSREGIPDDEIRQLLQKLIKQRRESAELYDKGGRPELAAGERAEAAIIEGFLPKQLDPAAMAAAVDQAVTATGAASLKDMGKVMAYLKERHAGTMDFAAASALVKARLSPG